MANVRAKFQVRSVSQNVNRDGERDAAVVEMYAVYANSPENAEWSQYTPNGSIKLSITKGPAMDAFRPGEEYYVDFTKAEPA